MANVAQAVVAGCVVNQVADVMANRVGRNDEE